MLRVQQKMEGKVVFNDGDFAEIAVAGVEGEEAGKRLVGGISSGQP